MNVFGLSISRNAGSGSYNVQVDTTSAGESSADFDVDVEALLAQRVPIQTALLASAVATRGRLTPLEKPVRDLGTALFAALFSSPRVSGRYQAALAIARSGGEPLRVALRINAPELAALPWEAMYDTEAGEYVCRSEPLVRRVPVGAALTPLAVTAPLRILGIVSAPRGLAGLDVEKEKEQLAAALRRPIDAGAVELTWAPAATWATLQELLLGEQWHVVHFIGHGDFDTDAAEGILALVGDGGRVNRVPAGRFADLLRQSRPMPRLVVLNSCSSAASGAEDLFSGTAATLVRGGVRAVAAMQFSVTDRAAIAFSHAFYTALAYGRGVDDAVHSGRVGILGTSGHTLEWLTPVLYLRGDDAHLFTITRTPETTPAAHQPVVSPPEETNPAPAPSAPWRRLGIVTTPRPGRWRKIQSTSVNSLAFSPDGRLLAGAGVDCTVRLWSPPVGQPIGEPFTGHTNPVCSVAFSPDGYLLASADNGGTARLWSPDVGQAVGEPFRVHPGAAWSVAFSPDGRLLASAGSGTVRLWNPATRQPAGGPFTGHTGPVWSVAFSPDGRLLASAGLDSTVRLWNLATGGPAGESFSGHTGGVQSVAFSPDGRLLASGGGDSTVRFWNPATDKPVGAPLTGHTGGVRSVAFRPDGRLLASAGGDGTVRLWNPATGEQVGAPLTGQRGTVRSVAFSPDGRLLASAGNDGTVHFWGE